MPKRKKVIKSKNYYLMPIFIMALLLLVFIFLSSLACFACTQPVYPCTAQEGFSCTDVTISPNVILSMNITETMENTIYSGTIYVANESSETNSKGFPINVAASQPVYNITYGKPFRVVINLANGVIPIPQPNTTFVGVILFNYTTKPNGNVTSNAIASILIRVP